MITGVNIEIPGVLGHTRSTWRDETHLRGVLLRLIAENPDATRDELEDMYLDKTRGVQSLVDEALRRAFDNDLKRAQQPARPPRPISARDVAATAQRVRTVVFLDLVQPNGKALRDCTGEECRQAGGWLIRVADRVGDAVVGATISEEEVASIFASSMGGDNTTR